MSNITGINSKPFLSGIQAATHLGLVLRTLERWRVEGSGPRFVKIGRKCVYRISDLDSWMDSRTFSNTAESKRSAKLMKAA